MASLGSYRRLVCLVRDQLSDRGQDIAPSRPWILRSVLSPRYLGSETGRQRPSRKSAAAASHAAGRGVGESSSPLSMSLAPGAARSALPLVAVRNGDSAGDPVGLVAATPITPSGYGASGRVRRDHVFETFGREITQQELDHLARPLFRGLAPNTLATILWRSPEHLAMLRSHTAPHVTYAEAWEARAAGRAARGR